MEQNPQLTRTLTNFMRQNIDNHVDPKTDEVNTTSLAEAAAAQYNVYEDEVTYTIPEWLFDLALDVSERHG